MKVAVAITNHNQADTVSQAISALRRQTRRPDVIFVCSDAAQYEDASDDVVCIDSRSTPGRCGNRNSVYSEFMDSGCDIIIFMDGDCRPEKRTYIQNFGEHLLENDLVFGTRRHDDIDGSIRLPASDFLTANMDNMWSGDRMDYTDLRVVSGAVDAWHESDDFDERLDLMLTGMIGWSCNFGFTRKGMARLISFMGSEHGVADSIFDSNTFSSGWGYEDVAMGIDAMYAGLKIDIFDDIRVLHRAHERSDGLFDHVRGRHLIMDRYRGLAFSSKLRDRVYTLMIVVTAFFFAGVITGLVTGFISANAIQ